MHMNISEDSNIWISIFGYLYIDIHNLDRYPKMRM